MPSAYRYVCTEQQSLSDAILFVTAGMACLLIFSGLQIKCYLR